ncbi:DUF1707 domain-containing protein [Geodermatophilaceae bacterium NBWT11]|nr:DUF1707 domain-containing protein [Geodermatophilaceae bacterium NBWT11]
MSEPQLRAADADRASVAEVLGTALHEGRLQVEEYDERLTAAYAARTHGELAALTADLPAALAPSAADGTTEDAEDLGAVWRHWAFVAALVWGIWLMSVLGTGDWLYPWPVWVVGPWGVALLARTVTTRRRTA